MKSLTSSLAITGLAVSLSLSTHLARADVRKDGTWPAEEKKLSFEFEGKPSAGVQKLAEAAGWSLVLSDELTLGDRPIHVNVQNQPADAVLEALFVTNKVVAHRNGTLVTITPEATERASSGAAAPLVRGEDRRELGRDVRVSQGDVAHDVSVTGGDAHIDGTVTGEVTVVGGSVHVGPGGHVLGDVSVIGGTLHLGENARIEGDVTIVGGSVHRASGSVIKGKVTEKNHSDFMGWHLGSDSNKDAESDAASTSKLARAAHSFGSSLSNMALLFVYGCVLLALASRRMDRLGVEVAAKPMRAFALGIVGSLAFLIAFIVACVTIIGIPFALGAVLMGILAVYGSMAAALTTVGAVMLRHKTQSPYLHLFAGCTLFLVLLLIPYVGGLAAFALTMVAIGTLIATRGGKPAA